MSGEPDLDTLLRSMKPEMQEGVFVFCTLPEGNEIPADLEPVHIFHEREGTAFVVRREAAIPTRNDRGRDRGACGFQDDFFACGLKNAMQVL